MSQPAEPGKDSARDPSPPTGGTDPTRAPAAGGEAAQGSIDQVRARLAAIIDSSDDAIISKTPQGIITSWNRGAEKLFGYTAEEAIGAPMLMLFPPDRVQEEPAI